jgi:katanin p60 ATPase-containing subunit A1
MMAETSLTPSEKLYVTYSERVYLIAATNLPWELDEALRRRLEKRIYIPLPSEEGRKRLFHLYLKSVKLNADVDVAQLARESQGYSGADIANVCRDASMTPMRNHIAKLTRDQIRQLDKDAIRNAPICLADFRLALAKMQRSVGAGDVAKFQTWMKEFGSV